MGESSSSAQIRALLDGQRQVIIEEYCEKVSHHELQTARAEQERRILQEELWRQQQDFREVHQQSLTEMEGITKIPEFYLRYARKTEGHRGPEYYYGITINCMSDSQDFQDAESVRSGNSHVANQQMKFPRAAKKSLHAFGIHLVYRETFLQIHMLPLQFLVLKN